MFKRILANVIKDVKLGWRSYFFLIVIGVALGYFLIISFVLPESVEEGLKLVLYDEAGTIYIPQSENLIIAENREDLENEMGKDFNIIGVIIKASGDPGVELVFQGYESERTKEIVRLMLSKLFTGDIGIDEDITMETLNPEISIKVPMNKWFLPVLLLMEAVLLGVVLVFAMSISEKTEKTQTAYMVTPGRALENLIGKIVLFEILGLLFTYILTPLVVGTDANYPFLTLVVIVGSFFATSFALIFATFYDNMSQALFPMMAAALFFALPVVSYIFPAFTPMVIRLIPTYPILITLKEAAFPGYVGSLSLPLLLYPLVMGAISLWLATVLYLKNARKG
ncbi:hypothetical protein AT15_05510 [Kosmotoga arenicorallina S304]|uniref:ABC transporter permease n=1 Tax=Kosmotoga arenicorallina S304 TaxID=1453497 RepID=A0A182C7G3_9BACT|nr:ABC transporter permease [Kosmotoga arenicorallina]OAA31531.1 hypothetical protein AT15_05510 [Kosmotoga arenicorallina S304]